LIQTLDFLTPMTDSPYEFGQIAAANSLSDVYAMGGIPITVMNIVCFPCSDLDEEILSLTLKGAQDKIDESGATLVGGHSVDDQEFKYGLSVTGIVHPEKVLTNTGVCKGDVIILTKPVGTGVISTAIKAKLADEQTIKEAVTVMAGLNKYPDLIFSEYNVTACTDVTGFGLAGHLLEMAKGSKKEITLNLKQVPLLKNAREFARMGMVPAGAHKNRKFFEKDSKIPTDMDRSLVDLMFDPQTSGGLLFSLNKTQAKDCIQRMAKAGVDAWVIAEISGDNGSGFLSII
jgi:selenide, water dikinase